MVQGSDGPMVRAGGWFDNIIMYNDSDVMIHHMIMYNMKCCINQGSGCEGALPS